MPEERPELNSPKAQEDPLAPGDALWDALGQAPKEEPDPWLATKTMARLRREAEATPEVWWRSFSWARLGLAGGAMAALVLGLASLAVDVPDEGNEPRTIAFEQADYELLQSSQPVFEPGDELGNWEQTSAAQLVALDEETDLNRAFEWLADDSLSESLFDEASWQ